MNEWRWAVIVHFGSFTRMGLIVDHVDSAETWGWGGRAAKHGKSRGCETIKEAGEHRNHRPVCACKVISPLTQVHCGKFHLSWRPWFPRRQAEQGVMEGSQPRELILSLNFLNHLASTLCLPFLASLRRSRDKLLELYRYPSVLQSVCQSVSGWVPQHFFRFLPPPLRWLNRSFETQYYDSWRRHAKTNAAYLKFPSRWWDNQQIISKCNLYVCMSTSYHEISSSHKIVNSITSTDTALTHGTVG